MLIREKIGFYAGQVREFPSHVGLELIRNGRGENPFAEPAPKLQAEVEAPLLQPGTPHLRSTKHAGRKSR
jgi:hypothetical protein